MRNIEVDKFHLFKTTHVKARGAEVPLVLAPGLVGGHRPFSRMAGALATRAAKDGSRLAVYTYDDPKVGKYDQDYRTERFADVMNAFNGPVDAIGHSRGWTSAVEASHQLVQEERLRSLWGLTPTDPIRNGLVHGLAKETVYSTATFMWRSTGALATAGWLAANATGYFVPHFLKARADILETLDTRVAEEASLLSHRIPMGIMTAEDDGLSSEATRRLRILGGFRGHHGSLPTTHLGALADPRQYDAIYDFSRIVSAGWPPKVDHH